MSAIVSRGLAWTNVRDYLVSRGYRALPTGWTDAGVFRHGDVEVTVPFDSTFSDYAEALDRAVQRIARAEGRSVAEVVTDLAMPRADGTFEHLARVLRPTDAPPVDVHVGRVVELKGDVNADGRLEGEVVLRLDADDELIRARCWLGPDDYMKALVAHGRQRPVSLHGRLTRAGRSYTLEEPSDLNMIE